MTSPRSRFRDFPNRRGAFTLIQMIAAIGVTVFLVSLLLGTLGQLSRSNRSVQCINNLRQWAVLFAMYQAENRGAMPLLQPYGDGRAWSGLTSPLVSQIDHGYTNQQWIKGEGFNGCPERPSLSLSEQSSLTSRYYSYAYNARLSVPNIGTTYRGNIRAVGNPSKVVMLADAAESLNITLFYDSAYIGMIHKRHCNALFADGHVETLTSISSSHINP